MGFPIEILLGEDLGGVVEGLVLDEDGAQDRALGFEIMGQRPLESGILRQAHLLKSRGGTLRSPKANRDA